MLSWLDILGCLAKWVIKLGEFDFSYCPRPSQKVQVLANFLMECMWTDGNTEEVPIELA